MEARVGARENVKYVKAQLVLVVAVAVVGVCQESQASSHRGKQLTLRSGETWPGAGCGLQSKTILRQGFRTQALWSPQALAPSLSPLLLLPGTRHLRWVLCLLPSSQ